MSKLKIIKIIKNKEGHRMFDKNEENVVEQTLESKKNTVGVSVEDTPTTSTIILRK